MFSIPPHIPNHIVTMLFASLIFVSCLPYEFHLVTRTVLPKVEKQIALADIIMIMKRGILDDVDDLGVYVDDGMIKKTPQDWSSSQVQSTKGERCNLYANQATLELR